MGKTRYKTKSAVFLLLLKNNTVLLQKRMNTGFMDGYYDLAVSGHVEEGESITQALIRETKEECLIELEVSQPKLFTVLHQRNSPENVYYYFYFLATLTEHQASAIQIGECQKMEELEWFNLDRLPENLLSHNKIAIENYFNQNPLSEIGFE